MGRTGRAVAALLAASVAVAAAGCSAAGDAETAPTRSAAEVLAGAAALSSGLSFTFTHTYGSVLASTGARDAAGRDWHAAVTFQVLTSGLTIKADVAGAGAELIVRLDLGPATGTIPGLANLGDRWLRLDPKKVGPGLARGLTPGGAVVAPAAYLDGVVSAQRVSDAEFRGVIDLAKPAPAVIAAGDLAALGQSGRQVPFTAALDGDGRLARIALELPRIGPLPAGELVTTYAQYGTAVPVQLPAKGGVVVAPSMVYQLFV